MTTEKKPIKTNRYKSKVAKKQPPPMDGGVVIPESEKQHLVAAAAYFRAARYRAVGAEGCRSNDQCVAAMEIEAVLNRHRAGSRGN